VAVLQCKIAQQRTKATIGMARGRHDPGMGQTNRLLSCGNAGAPGRIRTCGLCWQTQLAPAVFLGSSIPPE
jgi:hypothetical protein